MTYDFRTKIEHAGFLKFHFGNIDMVQTKTMRVAYDDLDDEFVMDLILTLEANQGLFIYFVYGESSIEFFVQHWTPELGEEEK